jgi:hypothetical protein
MSSVCRTDVGYATATYQMLYTKVLFALKIHICTAVILVGRLTAHVYTMTQEISEITVGRSDRYTAHTETTYLEP